MNPSVIPPKTQVRVGKEKIKKRFRVSGFKIRCYIFSFFISLRSVVANLLDCDIEVTGFEFP